MVSGFAHYSGSDPSGLKIASPAIAQLHSVEQVRFRDSIPGKDFGSHKTLHGISFSWIVFG